MTVLVCSAHADDEVIGVGGTIARFAREGEKVIVLIFSYGAGSIARMSSLPLNMPEEKLIKRRVYESQRAGDILGVSETIFLGLTHEGMLAKEFTAGHRQRIIDIIRQHKPSKIFYHSMKDGHADHRFVTKTMNEIIVNLEEKPEIYTYQVNMFDFSSRDPKIIMDVTQDYKKKLKALECFKSQRIWTIPLKPMILLKGIYYGKKTGVGFAEYFFAE